MSSSIASAVRVALSPGNFFVAPPGELRIDHAAAECCAWEIFRGHLLDESQTRETQTFESWHVFRHQPGERSERPLISVRLNIESGRLFVVRNILVYGHEAFETSPGTIDTRPIEKWRPELVGSLPIDRFADDKNVGGAVAAISALISRAMFGTRLPVASHEAPLPAFLLGQLSYDPPAADVGRNDIPCAKRDERGKDKACVAFAGPAGFAIRPTAHARHLETALRTTAIEDVPDLADEWFAALSGAIGNREQRDRSFTRITLALFRGLALTPYISLAGKLSGLLRRLAEEERLGPPPVIGVLCQLLRQLAHHLTAFDLRTFHNLGADYPDLLLLDELLKLLIDLVERSRGEFLSDSTEHAVRRSAFLQAWLARKRYEQLPVPAVPTSPGDNQRAWPPEVPRVPDEAIFDPKKRTTRLFADDPLDYADHKAAADILRAAAIDLDRERFLRELGTALFLDRPLGAFKPPGEIDRTPLLSYRAFSKSIAARRIAEIKRLGGIVPERESELDRAIQEWGTRGYALDMFHAQPRPGVATLADAPLASPDFVFLRTTRISLDEFLAGFDLAALRVAVPRLAEWLNTSRDVLLIRTSGRPGGGETESFLTALDEQMQPRLRFALGFDQAGNVHYEEAGGVEYPTGGLDVVWPVTANLGIVGVHASACLAERRGQPEG